MTKTAACPNCGAELTADAPAGLCPACLVAAGLQSENVSEPEIAATTPIPSSSGFEPPPAEQLAPLFPQLEILEMLGRGGMGAVYKARQQGLDRLVAVKILPPEVGNNPAFAERFTREARAMAKLSHPNIVAVHDFGQAEGLYYFVMEYVDGANLRQTMQSGNIPPEAALAIVPQICDALQYAHEEGVVHRDIKPENILLDKRGRLKIADFGLSKLLREDQPDHSLTGTHQVMGTLRYMAPEQMEGTKSVDHRADIYSLGVVFYELLTGQLPMGSFDPPSKKVQIDVRLDDVVLRALAQEPDKRYQRASEVKTDVESIHATQSPTSNPQTSESLHTATSSGGFDPRRWWVCQPNKVRKPLRGLLWIVFLALAIMFISFGWREQTTGGATSAESQIRVFEIGAFDPWFQREIYQGPRDGSSNVVLRGSSGINILSLSMLAGVLAALLLSVLVGIEKLEYALRMNGGDAASVSAAKWFGKPLTQIRFAVCDEENVFAQAIFHFSALGYDLIQQRSDASVFQRGSRWAGLWSTDIREYQTRLTVRTSPASKGDLWVSCDWSVRTGGSWITKRDVQILEAEGHDFEALLSKKATGNEEKPGSSSSRARGSFQRMPREPEQRTANSLPKAGTALIVSGSLLASAWIIVIAIFSAIEDSGPEGHEFFRKWFPLASLHIWYSLIAGALSIRAGLGLRSGESEKLARVAAILGMVPCSLAWVVSFPVGLWVLAVLKRPQTQAAFEQAKQRREKERREIPREESLPYALGWLVGSVWRHAPSSATLAIILCACGVIGIFPYWMHLQIFHKFPGGSGRFSHLATGLEQWPGVAAGITFGALGLLLLATSGLKPAPRWRAAAILIGGALALGFVAIYQPVLMGAALDLPLPSEAMSGEPTYVRDTNHTITAEYRGWLFELFFAIALLVTGAIHLRAVLASPAEKDEAARPVRWGKLFGGRNIAYAAGVLVISLVLWNPLVKNDHYDNWVNRHGPARWWITMDPGDLFPASQNFHHIDWLFSGQGEGPHDLPSTKRPFSKVSLSVTPTGDWPNPASRFDVDYASLQAGYGKSLTEAPATDRPLGEDVIRQWLVSAGVDDNSPTLAADVKGIYDIINKGNGATSKASLNADRKLFTWYHGFRSSHDSTLKPWVEPLANWLYVLFWLAACGGWIAAVTFIFPFAKPLPVINRP